MKEVPYHNSGKTIKTIAGRSIPPGETRMIPENELPRDVVEEIKASLQPPKPEAKETGEDKEATADETTEPTEAAPDDRSIDSILDAPVKEIIPLLPGFDMETLVKLRDAEANQSSEPRVTLIEALDKALDEY